MVDTYPYLEYLYDSARYTVDTKVVVKEKGTDTTRTVDYRDTEHRDETDAEKTTIDLTVDLKHYN